MDVAAHDVDLEMPRIVLINLVTNCELIVKNFPRDSRYRFEVLRDIYKLLILLWFTVEQHFNAQVMYKSIFIHVS